QKKSRRGATPLWYFATSAYSSTGLPHTAGCPLASHPTSYLCGWSLRKKGLPTTALYAAQLGKQLDRYADSRPSAVGHVAPQKRLAPSTRTHGDDYCSI